MTRKPAARKRRPKKVFFLSISYFVKMWCRLVWRASFQIWDGIGATGMPWMATQDAIKGEA
jgi:hypothetical protein